MVKNLRRCSPRARWKIEAPCMTVLSTSKNAARVGSAGRRQRASRPRRPRRPPRPASADRLLQVRAGDGGARCGGSPGGPEPSSGNPSCPGAGLAAMCETHADVADLARRRAAAEQPRPASRSSRPPRAHASPGPSSTTRSPGRRRPRRRGLVAGHRVMIAIANRIEFVDDLPRRAARPAGRRPGQPALRHRRAGRG